MVGGVWALVSMMVRSSGQVRPYLGLFFQIPYYSLAIILVSASSSCFTLAVPLREVSCLGYTPRAWDTRSLQSMLNGPLYFSLWRARVDLSLLYARNNNNNNNNPAVCLCLFDSWIIISWLIKVSTGQIRTKLLHVFALRIIAVLSTFSLTLDLICQVSYE